MDLLSGSESDSTDKAENGFKINKKYAKSYETWRRKEEKQKLIDKYGDDLDSSSDSDEDLEIKSSNVLDKEWLRAYAVVRFKQPRLYSGQKLFNEEVEPVAKKSEKKVTLKDHERKFILEKGGVASEDEDDSQAQNVGQTYFEEQEEIKTSLKKAIGELDDDDKEDSLLVKKTKTAQEKKQEENDYLAWLKGEKEELDDKEASKELAPLKEYWNDPNLTDKEKVLRDYILNNGYMDKERSDDEDSEDDDAFDFKDEEEFLDQADKYEKTYNFRHEEPGGCEIKTYPRMIESSVRAKEDNRRAEKRKRKMEKKQREKEQRMEEIKVLQRLQREEKEQKLQKLKDLAENQDLMFDLETDFDPEEHDKIMKKYFDDSYYHEGAGEKPVFDENETMEDETYRDKTDDWWHGREKEQLELEEDIANEELKGEEELYADDPGFVMDADYDPEQPKVSKSKKEMKKSKKKKKLDKAPLFDPTTKSFDEYLDDYLKDKINRLPFTYREVMPNDFGLSTDEIFSAQDKELNAWVSVKKMSMYLSEQDEKHDIHKFRQKSQNVYKKQKVFPSLAPKQSSHETSDISRPVTKKKKKKKKQPKKEDDELGNEASHSRDSTQDADKPSGSKKKKQKVVENDEDNVPTKDDTLPSNPSQEEVTNSPDKVKSKKKSKKRKHSLDDGQSLQNDSLNTSSADVPKVKSKKQKIETGETDMTGSHVKTHSKKSKNLKQDATEELHNSKTYSKAVEEDGLTGKTKSKKHKKKKKSKLKLDESDLTEHKPVVTDKKKVKKGLRKVMSASRLGSYGFGPGASKHANKLNKKKKKTQVTRS